MAKSLYEVLFYSLTSNGLYIQLQSNNDQSIYFYYETLGTVDIRDVYNEWIGGEIYDEIYEFVEDNCNTLINLVDGTI